MIKTQTAKEAKHNIEKDRRPMQSKYWLATGAYVRQRWSGNPNLLVLIYSLSVPDECYYVPDECYYVPDECYYLPDEGYYVPDECYYVPDEGYYVPNEGYSRSTSCALNWISTLLLPLAKQKHIQIMINWTHICQNTTHFYRHYDKQSRLSVFTWILMHFVLVRNITVFTLWETKQIVGFHLNLDVLVRNIIFFTIWETEQIVCFHLNLDVLVRNITFFTLWETEQIVCFLLTLDVLVRNITKGPGELLPSLGVRRLLSVFWNFSHFKLLLRNHWANWTQT